MLLKEANAFCERLYKDESGAVLAVTMVVFLTLFVICGMVFSVGENVRQRIEIQNAADAAAYSGAVVQADGLARMAAINRAMTWTYVQMSKMQMDYIVAVWLKEVEDRYDQTADQVKNFNAGGCLSSPVQNPAHWVAGSGLTPYTLNINGRMRSIYEVKAFNAANALLRSGLHRTRIRMAQDNIVGMNDALMRSIREALRAMAMLTQHGMQ